MRLPQLTELPATKENIEEFRGYNHNIRIAPNEWYDQKNMTTDDYPVASTRNKRQTVFTALPDVTIRTTGETDITCKSEYEGYIFNGDNLVTMHSVKNGSTTVGHWLRHNTALVSETNTALIRQKMTLFDTTNTNKRQLVNMGANVFVAPDCVVYNTTDSSVRAVNEAVSQSGLTAVTVVKVDPDTGTRIGAKDYAVLGGAQLAKGEEQIVKIIVDGEEYKYRYNKNHFQKYIDDGSLWVNDVPYLMLYKEWQNSTFGNLREGDVISVTGAMSEDNNIHIKDSVKIIKRGKFLHNLTQVDYIVVEGLAWVIDETDEQHDYIINTRSKDAILTRKKPTISFACESQNRIWACSADGHEIYASALGDPFNFYDYSGLSTDSYAVNVGSSGKFTGCINYRGMPIFFKEHAAYIMSGSYPTNNGNLDGGSYTVTEYTNFRGVEEGSENSLVVIDNILYYKSKEGVVAFDGNSTAVISGALGNKKYHYAVAGTNNSKLYISMQDVNGNHFLFVYDVEKGMWSKEDNTQIRFHSLCSLSGYFGYYFVNGDDTTYKADVTPEEYESSFSGGLESSFEWFAETGNIGYEYPNNKYISRFQLRLQIAEGANASVYVQYDSDGVWHKKGDMSAKGTKSFLIPIVPQRCDHMKIKIAGKGEVKIISLAKILEEGGDV